MAKDFAKAFYNSKAWERERDYILKRDHYICTEPFCNNVATEVHHIIEINEANVNDPNITLNENNLRSLCHECHTKITRRMKANGGKENILEDIRFDENGFPVSVETAPHLRRNS